MIRGDLSDLDLSDCAHLKEIDFSFNAITAIHASLLCLPSLHRLALKQNKITTIHFQNDDQCNSHLIDLYFGQNKLSNFPFDKIKFPLLKLLDLKANNLNKISGDVARCTELERL